VAVSEHDDGFDGPATLVFDQSGSELAVTVRLRGLFQPIDGYYHWYGRVDPSPELTARLGAGKASVRLRTSYGEAPGELSDPDPWGRYRIDGVSRPPFRMAVTLADL
jgi:hypothetical protein